MIISSIISGTGNQLFQYAAAYALAMRHGVPLRLDTRFYQTDARRPYELNRFCITAKPIGAIDRLRIRASYLQPGRSSRLRHKLPIRKLKIISDISTERAVDGQFNQDVLTAGPNTLLKGYWQNERYFSEVAGDIRREFGFATSPDAINAAMLDQIGSVPAAICVHVRRGDYLSGNEVVSTCPDRYYADAIQYMQNHVPAARYFVFSDDLPWARANLPVPSASQFVSHNIGRNDVEDLRLMSACNHFIIANSTFSWWGAWLGRKANKIVVAPRRWFAIEHGGEAGIVPAGWVRL